LGHEHSHGGSRKRVAWAFALTASFMVAEVVGGLVSGSLALLADAGHMLTDAMALALAWAAFRVSDKPADRKRTFGYHRFQILAAFVNGLSLLFIVGWILVEALHRILSPIDVASGTMLIVAGLGLVVNIVVFLILHGGDRTNLNLRGAALHVLGDLLGSVAAILVAALILNSAWHLVRRSTHILLEGAPEWLDIEAMKAELIRQVPSLQTVDHVHVWALTPERLMLTMHVTLNDQEVAASTALQQIKRQLRDSFGIHHSTIEIDG
jgi:cobalt-zinc-cadmium efflux system protein